MPGHGIASRTLEDLGWPTLVDHWAKRCATRRGEAAVRGDVLYGSLDDARARAREISEARALASRDLRLPLGGIADIAAAIDRVKKAAALEAPELVAVASTGRALARLRAHLREHGSGRLAAYADRLADLGHVFHPILDAFDADGRLVDHASDALGGLRRAAAALKATLEKRMDSLLGDERFSTYLQDAYYTQREDRYVLPIRTDGKGFVRGIVHGTSQSGQTLFIEPEEIVELNNRLKLAESEVVAEEHRIFIKFSGWIAEEAEGFLASLAAAETLDVIAAAAIMADDTVSAEPILDEAPRIALLHARHPLMLLAERRCVANDVTVAAGQTLLISGPNAGGKTVALKTVGLAAVMARAGLHLTCESGSAIGWFHDIVTDIGDAQNLDKDLSTFSGHVVNLRELLAHAAPGMLILIDEIAVGTDPDQGAALAQAVLEALAAKGLTGLVTTHYDRLKTLGNTAGFANASVGFDLERLEPTFKLHLGMPGSSGALAVATRMGLGKPVVERARELLGVQGAKVEDLLANVADQQRRLEYERAALLAALEEAESERAAMRMHRDQANARYEKQIRAAHGEAFAALRSARREIDDIRKDLRAKQEAQQLTADDARAATRRLVEPGAEIARQEPRRKLPPGTPATVESLVIGAPVIVPRLGRAEVVAPPHDGKVEVRLGQMKALVPVADVLMDSHRAARAAERERERVVESDKPDGNSVVLIDGVPAGGKATSRTIDSTIDVRGQRVDEAVAAVDRFLDESLMASRDTAFVVHGHGTGALRAAIRTHLATHHGIEKFRAGEQNEGGDGVTVAFLKG
ncbi:MAG TPA: Smr/MutS family protein [Kofleriaceae bacterium]|nr:Smr/MutS family protein [Kofleriaceae bacterium]